MEKLSFSMNKVLSLSLFLSGGGLIYSAFKLKILMMNIYILKWTFFSLTSLEGDFMIYMDWIWVFFSASVLLIAGSVTLFSSYYMGMSLFYLRFHLLLVCFVFSMILMVSSPSVLSILLGWDGLGVTSFILVIYYQNSKSISAGSLTMFTNRLGDIAVIMAFSLSVSQGNFNMPFTMNLLESGYWGAGLILLAGMTKSAQVPFSAWLPAAMAAPTPVSSLVHSSTLVTAGVYLMIRFFEHFQELGFLLGLSMLGSMTMVMAGFTAYYANDLKKVVAFSTLSQLGFMFLMVGLGAPEVAFYHLLLHAYFKAMLFMVVGKVLHLSGDWQDFKKISVNSLSENMSLFVMLSSNFSLLGIPFISGYYSKDMGLEYFLVTDISVSSLLLVGLGVGLTILYSMRLIVMLWKQMNCNNLTFFLEIKLGPSMGGVLVLWGFVITSGAFLSWVFPSSLVVTFVSFYVKMFILFYVVSLMAVLQIFSANSLFYKPKYWALSTLWALGLFSSAFFVKSTLSLAKEVFSKIDSSWMNELTFNFVTKIATSGQFFLSMNYLPQLGLHMMYMLLALTVTYSI